MRNGFLVVDAVAAQIPAIVWRDISRRVKRYSAFVDVYRYD
jgi:hypothetical protein